MFLAVIAGRSEFGPESGRQGVGQTTGWGAGSGNETYFAVTSECVMAWTERAMRFCTPTLRISFAT